MWGWGRDASQAEGLEGLQEDTWVASGEFQSMQPCGQSSPLPAAFTGLCWEPTCPAVQRQCELALTLCFCSMQDPLPEKWGCTQTPHVFLCTSASSMEASVGKAENKWQQG